MFDRLQKPFLTVETGEAYQPIRLSYYLFDKDELIKKLGDMQCITQNPANLDSWTWFWKSECDDLHFESVDSYRKNALNALRLGTITVRGNQLFLNLPSFKRACMAISFFYRIINDKIMRVHRADFINKVFAIDEKLPHGFTELFNEDELERIVHQREEDYHKIQEQCEHAASPEQAFKILSEYTRSEAKKTLPFAERFVFEQDAEDQEVVFLGFYIFLRGRELVAIKRWYGETGYTLADAADETFDQVFGGMGIDIIE